jgi:type I restriction enzyme S subunit
MSSSGWQSAKIDEVAEAIFSGGTPNTGKGEYWNGVYNWLSSGETRNVYITQTEKTITSEGINNSSTRLALKDDVVIASAGQGYTRGQVSYCMIDTYINQSIIAIRTKKDKLMSKYLFFNLRNRYQELRQISDGNSIRGSITTKHIKALDIIVPPLPEQKAIAATLACLDDKIELNNRINKTLEEMAQAIFKSWFIDFEPFQDGEFEDSELGLIPKGWRIYKLSEVIEINPTRKIARGSVVPYLDMSNMPTQGHSPSLWIEREVGSGMKFMNGDTLIARITPCLENGKTAYIDFLADNELGWGSTEYIVLRPRKPIPTQFAYLVARNERFRSFAVGKMTGSSGRQRVPADSIAPYPLILPPLESDIWTLFGRLVESQFEIMKNMAEQSRTLTKIRDTLLPKLMSGEIRVPVEEVE